MMQGLPTPPTDSLYKFIAITGVVLMIGSLYAYSAKGEAYDEWYYKQTRQDDERWYKAIFDKIPEGDMKDVFTVEHDQFMYEMKERIKSRDEVMVMCLLGALIGFIVSVVGFVLWWFKVQRYQDKILEFEYEQAKLEHEAKKLPS